MREKNRKISYIIVAVVFILMALLVAVKMASGQETPGGCDPRHKEWICHVPPGDPANVHSICIDQSAWEDPHEKHGDSKGTCPNPTITCGAPEQVAPGTVESAVIATGWQMTGPFEVFAIGPVTLDEFTCAPASEKKWACSYQGSGDPTYEGTQKLTVRFDQKYGDSVLCDMDGGAGGLPAELIEFGVE